MVDNRLTPDVLWQAVDAGKMVRGEGPDGREVQIRRGEAEMRYAVRYLEHGMVVWQHATAYESTALSLYGVATQLCRTGPVRAPFLGSCTDGMQFVMPSVAKGGIIMNPDAPAGLAEAAAHALVDSRSPQAWPSASQMREMLDSMKPGLEMMRRLNAEAAAEGKPPLVDPAVIDSLLK